MTVGLILLAWLLLVAFIFIGWQGKIVHRLWREPMLKRPVVVIESDDWGPGPASDAKALRMIADVLRRHRDAAGHRAVMTLGMLLAVPDTEAIDRAGGGCYRSATISEPRFQPILTAIREGAEAGVFSAQLHGKEHYWPNSIVKAAKSRAEVRGWLAQRSIPRTEDLPFELQSRWIDSSALPSRPLPDVQVEAAVRDEVESFAAVFGSRPEVVVPPTFVWTDAVESAWAANGAKYLVTPGRRHVARDREGKLLAESARFHNGEVSPSGLVYLVRNDYFEPALGHTVERAVEAVEAKSFAGRPTLFETHRFNFLGTNRPLPEALRELDRLLETACRRFPGLRFTSTRELAACMISADPDLVESNRLRRMRLWLRRIWMVSKLRKLAWITLAIVPAGAAYLLAGALAVPSPSPETAA